MDRSIFATLFSGLLGITSLGALGFLWAGPGAHLATEGGWRLLEPISYENITIFPVVSSSNQNTSDFLTLEEGLASGQVIVREQGSDGMARSRGGTPTTFPEESRGASVNQLVLINRSKRPLILLAGELVSGGKQDRIIAKDRIVAPGSEPLPLNVFCVEHGRWSAGGQFNTAKTIVHPSVREQAALKQDQQEVWASVMAGSTAAKPAAAPAARMESGDISAAVANEAPTQSYAKIYEGRRIGGSIDSFVEEVQRRFRRATAGLKGERVVGVVVAYGGEVAWSDIFASGELFDHYWTKLLRSYAVEALARPTLKEVASREDAGRFLRRLNGREVQESEPDVYRWREITEGRLSQIELDALQPKEMTLHRLLLQRTS